MRRLILLIAFLCLAGGANADERLRTYYRLKLAAAGVPVVLPYDPLAKYGQVETPPKGRWSISVLPVFGYDSNLNGGVPHDTVDINGLQFTVKEKDRAIAGLEAGLLARLGKEHFIAQGHRISGSLSAQYEHALSHDIASKAATASACYHFDARNWTFAQACLAAGLSMTELSETHTQSARVSIGRVLDYGKFPKSLQFGLSKTKSNEAEFTQIHANYNVNTERATFELGVTARVAGEGHSEDKATYLRLSRSVFGRPVSAVLRFSTASGSKFLGLPRTERTTSLSISLPLTSKIAFDLSYSETRSPLQYFQKKSLGANLVLTKF